MGVNEWSVWTRVKKVWSEVGEWCELGEGAITGIV